MTINKMYHKKTYIKCTTYVHEYKMYKKFAGKRLHSQNTLGLCTTSMLDVCSVFKTSNPGMCT